MATARKAVADSLGPNELMDMHRARSARAQAGMGLRQRRIVRRALDRLDKQLRKVRAGTWTEAEANATRVLLGQSVRHMAGQLELDLGDGLKEVTKMSAKDAARYLATLDQKYLGSVRPLRFDSLEWWEQTHDEIGRARLRMYSRSYQRYGGIAVAEIEDAISERILLGESWDKAREEVWDATRHVVGDRQWMVDRIVRTEVAAAYNGTTLAALREEDTTAEPMLKKLVATFDAVTGQDSYFVHGQTRPLNKPFMDDKAREYMAPPNRPHDREIVVGWRASWGAEGGENMSNFDEATATPRDDDPEAREWAKPKTVAPPPPPPDLPGLPAATTIPDLQMRIQQIRANKAALGFELQAILQSKIKLPAGIKHPPETVAMAEAHNLAVERRVSALRQEVRELQEEAARARVAMRRKREAEVKGAVAGEVPVARLPKPKAVGKMDGPGKPPKPKRKELPKFVKPAEVEGGQWVGIGGVPAEVKSVRELHGVVRYTFEFRGKEIELPIPHGELIKVWKKKPDVKRKLVGDGLDEAREFSAWAAQGREWIMRREAFPKPIPALGKFADKTDELMEEILDEARDLKIVQLSDKPAKKVRLAGKGTESAKLKRYVEKQGLAEKSRLSGLEDGLATELVSEYKQLHDKLVFRTETIPKLSVVNRGSSRWRGANAWVTWEKQRRTGVVTVEEFVVNAKSMGTRKKAMSQWKNGRRDLENGESPWTAAAYWDDPDAKFRQTIRHEFGHVVDFHLRSIDSKGGEEALLARGIRRLFGKRFSEVGRERISKMSRYAATNRAEALAEAFSLAVSGKWEHIPEELHQPLRLILLAR